MVASVTMVNGRPSVIGAERGGVGLHHAAGALAVDDAHHDGAGVRAAELGADRHPPGAAQPEGHVHHQHMFVGGLVVDDQMAERVRVEPTPVPGIEPIGDHVLRLAHARMRDHRADRLGERRPRRQRRPFGGLFTLGGQADPDQHAVVVRAVRAPGRIAAGREPEAVPAAVHRAVQHRAAIEQRAQMRAGAGPGHQRAVRSPPEDHLAAGDGPGDRLLAPDVGAGSRHEPAAGVLRLGDLQRAGDPRRFGQSPRRGHPVLPRLRHPGNRDPRPLSTRR